MSPFFLFLFRFLFVLPTPPPPRHTLDASRILAFSHNSGLAKNSRTILAHSRTFSHILAHSRTILAHSRTILARSRTVLRGHVRGKYTPPNAFFLCFRVILTLRETPRSHLNKTSNFQQNTMEYTQQHSTQYTVHRVWWGYFIYFATETSPGHYISLKNETQARTSLVRKSSTCARMILACENGARMVCENARMILACDSHRVYA